MSEDKKLIEKKTDKQFGLSTAAVKNRTSVIILALIIVISGLGSYITMPKELFPEVVFPLIYVGTPYPGNSPVDIENLITRPLEKEIKGISGIKEIRSTSIQDFSTVIVEFNPEEEIPKALQDVKDAVDQAMSELPTDLDQDPNVFEIDVTEVPIMSINVAGDYTLDELKEYAEMMEDEFETLTEISKVEIRGVLERQIRIDADPYAMEARKVSFNNIAQAVANENLTMSGGNILTDGIRRSLRIDGEFDSPQQLREVIVKDERGDEVYLRDVATVRDSYEEPSSISRSNLLPVVTVDIIKRSGENLLAASDKIFDMLDDMKANRLPDDLEITVLNDQSKQTRNQLNNLENSIISGVILVVLVLMFFLGLRNALFVGIAIPMSMFISFILLSAFGITLNLMVLFSLILALGMLVDNGIVAVENIYRNMQEGFGPIKAAMLGIGEIAMPIIASTATTVAAFVPLAFWGGLMGQFMRYLPITLIIVLSSSLFVALVVTPVLTSMFMKLQRDIKPNKKRVLIVASALVLFGVVLLVANPLGSGGFGFGNLLMLFGLLAFANQYLLQPGIHWFQKVLLPWLEAVYEKSVASALGATRKAGEIIKHNILWPIVTLAGTFVLLIGSIFLLAVATPKVEFFPVNEPLYVFVFIEKPLGTDIEETSAYTKAIEADIVETLAPYEYMVTSVLGQVGEGATDPNQFGGQRPGPNQALITVGFEDYEYRRGVSTIDLMEDIRQVVAKYPGAEITVNKDNNGPPTGSAIQIELSGEQLEPLFAEAKNLKAYIDSFNFMGVEELKLDVKTGSPELLVELDREKAQMMGLSTGQVANELRTALFGVEVSKFKDGEDDYDIYLRLADQYRYDVDDLMNKKIFLRDNRGNEKLVPISAVAQVKYTDTYGSVKRKDLDRVVTISSNVTAEGNATEVNQQIEAVLKGYDLPRGMEIKFGGEQEEQAKSMEFLGRAMLLAVMVIFLIIVAQFNSLSTPIIIILSVLFSTIGVFLGLVIFQMDFIVIMTGIGIISLAGIVVNNAIVLLDYTDLVKKRLIKERDYADWKEIPFNELIGVAIKAGSIRLRPVLLTAITTVLGLIPLAIGFNIDFVGLFTDYAPNIYWGGDNAIFWGPMALTIIFGLIFATALTLIVVPAMYILIERARYAASKVSVK